MARIKDVDFTRATDDLGSWLNTTGRAVVPLVLAAIAVWGVVTVFV